MKLIEYQAPTLANRLAHNRLIRRMAAEVMPRDRSWEVIAVFLAIWIPTVVLFVRWWLCV